MTEELPQELSGFELEEQADLLLMRDAHEKGQDFYRYCYENGLLGPAQRRRIRRHESTNFMKLLYPERLSPGGSKLDWEDV